MKLIQHFMRGFFNLLYHPFAFTYDLVASVVSFGKWNDWVFSILPFVKGTRILELGHGPGHLQRLLLAQPPVGSPVGNLGLFVVGVDESAQMGTLAKKRIGAGHQLSRALAQHLPFPNNYFSTIVATFPTDYIFNPQTLSEVKRCLSNSGRLIVLPAALPKSGFLRWLYKVTGESPAALDESIQKRFKQPFINAGFETEAKVIEVKSGRLIILIASINNQ